MECAQEEIIAKLSELIQCEPEILNDFPINLPNIRMPTMGGTFFWEDTAEIKGWRMQRNIITGHWRLLDPHNVRYAWGMGNKLPNIFIQAAGKEDDTEISLEQEEEDTSPDSSNEEGPDEKVCKEEHSSLFYAFPTIQGIRESEKQ